MSKLVMLRNSLLALTIMLFVFVPVASAAEDIGGDAPWRWQRAGNGHVVICVNNRSKRSAQTHVQEWAKADNLEMEYQPGPGGCDGFPLDRRLDIRDGSDTSRPCSYLYMVLDSNDYIDRMILYLRSDSASNSLCWNGTVKANNRVSSGIGLALGLAYISDFPPGTNYVSVMRLRGDLPDNVSYAQPGDWATFDFYN